MQVSTVAVIWKKYPHSALTVLLYKPSAQIFTSEHNYNLGLQWDDEDTVFLKKYSFLIGIFILESLSIRFWIHSG